MNERTQSARNGVDTEPAPEKSIPRARVERLAGNLSAAVHDILALAEAEEIDVPALLARARYAARTARRIAKRARHRFGPPPGQEKKAARHTGAQRHASEGFRGKKRRGGRRSPPRRRRGPSGRR